MPDELLTANELRALLSEYGSPAAAADARPELAQRLRATIKLSEAARPPLFALPDPDPIKPSSPHALDERKVKLLEEIAERLPRKNDRRGDRQPAETPKALIEPALRMKAEDLGRRRIAQAIPELTDWEAGRIVYWHGRGKPDGLWLDARGRLRWGRAISATRTGLRLPNPWKPAS